MAPLFLMLNVQQKHIDNGIAESCNKCPIALAVEEKYPLFNDIEVESSMIAVNFQNAEYMYTLPLVAQQFIKSFDCGTEVEPFFFTTVHHVNQIAREWETV